MRLDELLKGRQDGENFQWDFSNLSKEELHFWIHVRMRGEGSLTDSEMQKLERVSTKVKRIPGKPKQSTPLKAQWDDRPETAEEFMKKVMNEFSSRR